MPTYEYQCASCGNKWEKFQSIMAGPIKVCPKCGKRKAQRLIGIGAGVIFKGSGFYETDYRSESYKQKAKSDSDAAKPAADAAAPTSSDGKSTKADSTTPATSDSKPAAEKPAAPAPATAPPKAKSSSAKRGK